MRIKPMGGIFTFVFAAFCLATSSSAFDLFPLTCNSDNGRYKHCDVDTSHGVKLVTTWFGSKACEPGYSWGFDEGGVWVDRGCNAQFNRGDKRMRYIYPNSRDNSYYPDRPGDSSDSDGHPDSLISCSSNDGRRQYCNADTSGDVRLVRQRSSSPCRRDYSWGADRDGIWVDHGCRGDFALTRNGGPGVSESDGACSRSVGFEQARRMVDHCLAVSTGTHSPCNIRNSCQIIIDEIKRGCSAAGMSAPAFCEAYR